MGYKHLTREQRYTIEMLLQTPMSHKEIAKALDAKFLKENIINEVKDAFEKSY